MPERIEQSVIPLLGHEDCKACGLSLHRKHVVPGFGNPEAKLMFVGEAPGQEEDASGRPFVGKAGKVVRAILKGMGIDDTLCFWSNIYHCRPPGNKVKECVGSPCPKIWLPAEIAKVKPRVIVALGATAADHFDIGKGLNMSKRVLMDNYKGQHPTGHWIVCAYHPSYIMRLGLEEGRREANIALVSFVASLQRAMYYLGDVGEFLDNTPRDEYATRPG